MEIDGINITKEENCVVCHINDLTDEIKNLIREDLSSICHGRNEVEINRLSRHSYKNTLIEFIDRFSRKPVKTKKGMMGEFVAHLIIHKILPKLQKVTILFNKEELSIRKGFDLTYVEVEEGVIWYGEVKSGELGDEDTPNIKNNSLLHASKRDLHGFLTGDRPNLWNSVIIDVGLSLASNNHRRVKELLDEDLRQIEEIGVKKNAVLVSVLFHDVQNMITAESVKDCFNEIIAEDHFSNVIVFSIQKSTYSKIVDFLVEESRTE